MMGVLVYRDDATLAPLKTEFNSRALHSDERGNTCLASTLRRRRIRFTL
jgi:hypothetical protein